MKFKPKDKNKSEQHLILNLDLSLEDDFLEIDLDAEILNDDSDKSNGTEISARCVSVDTFSLSPLGRKKKKSVTAKAEIIKFRCSIYEKKLLKIKAKKSGLTLSEYFRRVALEQKITARLTDEQIGMYTMLIKYHNNFKSIGNMFKKRNPKLTETVHDLANEIKEHLKDFKSDR